VRRPPASRVLVLCYHAVSEDWGAALSVPPGVLRRQLATLIANGWEAATFSEAVLDPPARKTFAVTFDDGFRSVGSLAAPLLRGLDVPATVFVPTDWPGRSMRWPGIDHWADTPSAHELEALTWDELRALQAAGWEIAAHTCSHPHLTSLDEAGIHRELVESRAVCERELGVACRSVAYPFGDCDDRVRAAAAAAGYEAAAGLSSEAFGRNDRFEWPRVGVWHGEPYWRFRLKAAPVTSRVRGSAAVTAGLDVVERVRGRLRAA
jgi:peptidoglycan/xylan/chitin deacetylase (PgdA/CDA1 family)